MPKTIFYSWQNDISQNRSFIRQALDKAISDLSQEADVEEAERDLVADQDTQGLSGSPSVAEAILRKIREAHGFVADLTYIADRPTKGKIPNPNVLIEYGYALHALGDERIIAVQNDAVGGPEHLPFDLSHKRWPIRFRLDGTTDKAKEQTKLAAALKSAIRALPVAGAAPAVDPLEQGKDFARSNALEIERAEFLAAETGKIKEFVASFWPTSTPDAASINDLFDALQMRTVGLRTFMLLVGRWGTVEAVDDCQATIRKLSFTAASQAGFNVWTSMRELPSIICFYWLLAGAIARDDLGRAKAILTAPIPDGRTKSLFVSELIFAQDHIPWKSLKGAEQRHFPQSQWAASMMATDAAAIALSNDEGRELYFDTEQLLALEFSHHRLKRVAAGNIWFWAPGGDFLWDTSQRRFSGLAQDGYDPLIKAGLLGGTKATATEAIEALRDHVRKIGGFQRLEI